MIKLFGWERRVEKNVAEKRETELKYIWKSRILYLFNNIAKYVSNFLWLDCYAY